MGTTAQPACCTSHGSYPLGLGVPTLCQGCQGFPLRGGPLPNTRILPWYPCVANSARAFFSPPYSRALSPSILSPLSARCALADCCNVLLASSCCCCCTRSAARRSSPPACLVHSYFCPHYCPPPMIPSFASPAHSLTHRSSSFTHRYSSLLIAHFLLVTASPLLVAASYALTQ